MIINDQEVAWAYLLSPEFELSNSAGKPLTGGWIEVYIHGTRTKYYCASDFDGTLHPFKIPLDSLGSNIVLASPANAYDVYVYNKFGSLTMSRYNVQPKLGAGEIVHDEITVTSNDGTVNVEASGNTNYDLSIADTVSAVSSLQDAVSGLDIRVQDLESAVTGIEESLDGKKDLQAPYIASGTNVQTITKITQDEQGVMTVEYSDIQAQNPLTPGQYVTIDDDVISVTGLQPEGDYLVSGDLDSYATKDYVTAYVEEHAGDDQVQSDWTQTDSQAVDYIKNKPAEKVLVAGDHIDITSTVSSVEISAEGFATEDYVVDYVDSVISGIDPVDIISSDGTIVVSSTVSGSVKVFDLSVSGGQPVYFRGGETWVPVSGTTADFSRVKKFDGTIVPSDTVSGTVPLEDGLWAWDAIVDIYVSGHVNELVKCGIKGQAVGNGYDPDSETELLIDSTRPGVINSFTLTGLSRGGPNVHLAFTFTRENSSTSTMWVRMRRLSVYQVKGPGVSQPGGGGDYEAGYGIIINNNVISVNSALIPDIETVTNMIDASIDGLATEDYVTGYVESQVSGLQPAGDYLVPSDLDDYATHDEVNTVSGAIVDMIPEVEITPTLASGTKIAEYSIDGVSGELFAPFTGEVVYVTTSNTFAEVKGIIDSGKMPVFVDDNHIYHYLESYPVPSTTTLTFKGGHYPIRNAGPGYVGNNDVMNRYWKISTNNMWTMELAALNYIEAVASGALTTYSYGPSSQYKVGMAVNTDGTTIHVNENNELEVIGGGFVSGYVTEQELATVSGDIVNQIPTVEITPTLSSGTKLADYSIDGVSGEIYAPETVEVETAEVSAGSGISITDTGSGIVISCTVSGGGSTYTAGDYISIENDVIAVTGIDPESFASQADLEAVSAAIPSANYDLVAGQNITITTSGTNLVISGQQGGTNVTITPDYNSGTRVAQYSIDGVNGSIYTPTQVNANWNETSSSSKAYIQNKPTIHTYTGASGVAIDANDVVSLDSPLELIAGNNVTIDVSGVSAVISSTGGGGGTTYTAGNMISLANDAIAVSTTAGITDIQMVASLPQNPVSSVLYLIPEV